MGLRISKADLVVIAGIAIYISVHVAQTRAAANLCNRYSVGTRIEDVESLEGTFFLTRMGHIDPNIMAVQSVIFCAGMTMCDTSCRLEIEDRVVKTAKYSSS
jgi:hypothetical protein